MQSSKQALFLVLILIVLCVFYVSVFVIFLLEITRDLLIDVMNLAILFFNLIKKSFKWLACYIEALAKL